MSKLVSILIPAYNAEKWIAATLRSALAQTWDNKEIIVVDDGSTDGTLSVARSFEPQGVRVVSQTNQGAAAARNRAFLESRGDFIQWLDADDLLSPNKVEAQMRELQGKDVLLSSGWGEFLYRPKNAQFIPSALWADLKPADWLVQKLTLNLHMQTATWLVSRELTEAAGPWDTRLMGDDDGEYFCRVLLASRGVHFVPGPGVYYRATGASSLSYIDRSEKKISAHWTSMLLHIKYLRSVEESPRVRQACLNYLQNWLIYFYPEHVDVVREAEDLAQELGGRLAPPRLSWKYSCFKHMLGWRAAKLVQVEARSLRWSIHRHWDQFLSSLEDSSESTS
jgi:glycosyltransferase involved in cell wall biosynthesis